jgi:hypothetical protein
VATPTLCPLSTPSPAPPEGPAGTRLAPRTTAAGPSLAGRVVFGARVLRPRWLWWVVGWGLDRPSLRWISGLWNFSSSSPSFGISVRRSGCRGGRAAGLGPCLIRLVGRRIYPWAFGASGVHGGGRARQRRRASLLLRRRGGPLGMVTTGLNALPGASFLLWGSDGGQSRLLRHLCRCGRPLRR